MSKFGVFSLYEIWAIFYFTGGKKKKKLNVEMCCEDIIERTARQMKAWKVDFRLSLLLSSPTEGHFIFVLCW